MGASTLCRPKSCISLHHVGINPHRYLSEGFLSVIFQVFGIDVEMVLVNGEGLGAFGNAGDKLLHFQESAARPVPLEVPHRDVGRSDAI